MIRVLLKWLLSSPTPPAPRTPAPERYDPNYREFDGYNEIGAMG